MIITIDHGNTNCNVGLFKNGKVCEVLTYDQFIQENKINETQGAYSSVGERIDIPGHLIRPLNYREEKNFLEMPINYAETLGEDRLICSYLVFKKEHSSGTAFRRSLVIDAGTYLTVDCVSKVGFEGGFIFPGLQVYLNSYEWGAALPRISKNEVTSEEVQLPHDTKSAITESSKIYLQSSLEKIISKYKPTKVYLTGGNAKRIQSLLGKQIEVVMDKNLIHHALHTFFIELNPIT
jgi:type III pantothenate kinase